MEMNCTGCGTSLMAEAFAGPPRLWFASVAVLDIIRARHGWSEDGVCPECQEDDHER